MEENLDVEVNDINTENSGEPTFDEILDTEINNSNVETQEMTVEDGQALVEEESVPSGNMHVMIIVISICAVIGLALGIWRGIRAASK